MPKKKHSSGAVISDKFYLSHWLDPDGKTIQLKDMEFEHLINTIKLLEHRGDPNNWLSRLHKELDRRVEE